MTGSWASWRAATKRPAKGSLRSLTEVGARGRSLALLECGDDGREPRVRLGVTAPEGGADRGPEKEERARPGPPQGGHGQSSDPSHDLPATNGSGDGGGADAPPD